MVGLEEDKILMRTLFVCLITICVSAHAQQWFLPELEAEAQQALNVRIAQADTAWFQSHTERQRAESGWKFIGGSSLSDNEEATGVGGTRQYQSASIHFGGRYPLLGSHLQEQLALLKSETDLRAAQARERLVSQQVLQILRRRYISYWANQRKLELTRSFLDDEELVRNVLDKRTDRGLLLEADRLEFLTTFASARRQHSNLEAERSDDLAAMALISNQSLEHFVADYPRLPPPCLHRERLLAIVEETHPELEALSAHVDERQDERQFAKTLGIESGFNIHQTYVHEVPESITGGGTVLSVDIRMPLDYRRASRARRSEAGAALSKARLEFELRRRELRQAAQRLWHNHQSKRQNLEFNLARLAAADELVRERTLRAERLPGDVLEQLQQARFAYNQAALETVEAEAMVLDAEAQLLGIAPDGCAMRDSANPSTAALQAAHGLGVYLWDSEPLLVSSPLPESIWEQFDRRGIDRVLISLDGSQIKRLKSETGATRLASFIADAEDRGMRIELLLAEPTWMLASHRRELLAVIEALRDFDFDALHLDLEPNQLEGQGISEAEILDQLLITLSAAKAASPWPLGFSVHPRYVNSDTSEGSFGDRLAALELDEVTLMIYVVNPRRVRELSEPIIAAYPDTRFSIAQSIEDFLPAEETHAGIGRTEFQQRMQELARLFPEQNFGGIVVQAWRHYRYMSP